MGTEEFQAAPSFRQINYWVPDTIYRHLDMLRDYRSGAVKHPRDILVGLVKAQVKIGKDVGKAEVHFYFGKTVASPSMVQDRPSEMPGLA